MIKLMEFDQQYLEQTFNWMQNAELKKMFLLDKEITRESHLNWYVSLQKDHSQEIFAILYGDEHVGNVGIKNIDIKNKKAEVWIYLGNLDFRGKGIAKDSLIKLGKHKKNSFNKLYAQIASFNFISIKTFISAGYHIEGILQNEIILKERNVDIYRLYTMI